MDRRHGSGGGSDEDDDIAALEAAATAQPGSRPSDYAAGLEAVRATQAQRSSLRGVEEVQPPTQVEAGDFRKWKTTKFQKLDVKACRRARYLIDEGIAVGKRKELIESVLGWKEEKGFLTKTQRKLLQDLEGQLRDYAYERELCDQLVLAYNEDRTPKESEGFIRSVVDQFNETHTFSSLQREQIVLLTERANGGNEDTERDGPEV